MSTEDIKTLYRKNIEMFNQGNLEGCVALFSLEYDHHNLDLPDVHTLEEFRQHMKRLLMAFPGIQVTVQHMISEGTTEEGMLAVHLAFHWTPPQGLGSVSINQPIEFSGIEIFRLEKGNFREGWDYNTVTKVLAQLGLMPAHA